MSQKRLKPSLGNINVHRRESFVREPSASEILRDKVSSFCFIYVSRGKMNRSDIPTIQLSATPSRLISTHLHRPSIFTSDAFPAATLPLYRGLEQAP